MPATVKMFGLASSSVAEHGARRSRFFTVAPLALPLAAMWFARAWPAWQQMWLVALAFFFAAKWVTFARRRVARDSFARNFAYLFLWPNMDADAFCDVTSPARPVTVNETVFAIAKTVTGVALLVAASPRLAAYDSFAAGWIGMIGIVVTLHFGTFHLLSLGWRALGVCAEPIMDAPIRATSLADFWGRRWNRAFHRLTLDLVFRPLVRPLGVVGATLAAFAASGVVHDVVISWPERAGWGGPTLYFVVQGAAQLFERSRAGQVLGLGRGLRGRVFTALVVLGPAGWLLHEPFVRQTIIPTLAALRLWPST